MNFFIIERLIGQINSTIKFNFLLSYGQVGVYSPVRFL